MLAGRDAEEVLLGAQSSGAGGGAESDLAHATRLALATVTSFGLEPDAGLLWSGAADRTDVRMALPGGRALATRIRAIPNVAYAEALLLMRARVDAVEAVAARLTGAGALNGNDVAALVAANRRNAR